MKRKRRRARAKVMKRKIRSGRSPRVAFKFLKYCFLNKNHMLGA